MKRPDDTVKRETAYIFVISLLLSVFMQAVFLIVGHWDYTVLLGNLLGLVAAVGNFFLLGITVQTILGLDTKQAQDRMKLSQMLRLFLLFAVALVGYLIPVFQILAVVIPYLFPRIAIAMRPFVKKR